MKLYASRTGTIRNLEAIRAAGMGLLLSPAGHLRTEGFSDYVLDNGKWTAHTTGAAWDEGRFLAAVEALGSAAGFVVVPDIVAGGLASLELSAQWLPRLTGCCPLLLIAVQDGMVPGDLAPLLGPGVGVFLGGSTDWKLAQMEAWGRFCAARGVYFHVARVNSAKRLHLAEAAGADSVDGSSATRFSVTVPLLAGAARQRDLFSARVAR